MAAQGVADDSYCIVFKTTIHEAADAVAMNAKVCYPAYRDQAFYLCPGRAFTESSTDPGRIFR
jgi:hypothetical protein